MFANICRNVCKDNNKMFHSSFYYRLSLLMLRFNIYVYSNINFNAF